MSISSLFPINDGRSDLRRTTSIFAALMSLTLAVIYWLARVGFENPVKPVLEVLSISFFLLFSPYIYRVIVRVLHLKTNESWLTSDPLILTVALALLLLASILAEALRVNFFPIFG